jgi:Putative phage holin Dp-1
VNFSLNSKTYDLLKSLAQVWIPSLGTLYFAIAGIWAIPLAEQVVGSLTALDTFLGAVLAISTKGYTPKTDGNLVVDKTDPSKDVYSIELLTPIENLGGRKTFTLGVKPKSS